jgi:hypothetical protein
VVARLRALVAGAETRGAAPTPAPVSRAAARPASRVSIVKQTAPSAEDILPLEQTGTDGSF